MAPNLRAPVPAAVVESEAEAPKPIAAGRGRLEGIVVDKKNGEALIEAQVTILPLGRRVLTDIEGHYEVSLPPGTYDLRVFAELRAPQKFTSIKVEKGRSTRFDITLSTQGDKEIAIQEVVVVAKPDTATEAVQLVRRQKSAAVSDAISAEQIARSPDTNASEAVKRVVGATIQDGKYVIIRGLGGRYSLALLNGVALPSPDPDLPAAPLDIFPSLLLANLTIAKTSTPDMPGNFAGGALVIETRDFPSRFTLKLALGTSGDSQSTFRKVNTYEGGKADFLGFDDSTRALPSAVPRDVPVTDDHFTPEETAAIGKSFSNRWSLWQHRALPNIGLSATVGDTISLAGRKLGYLATIGYGHRWTQQRAHIALEGPRGPDGLLIPSTQQLDSNAGTESALLSGLVNVGYQLSAVHRLSFIALYSHTGEDSATSVTGIENNGNDIFRLRFRMLERQLQFNQLTGEHAFLHGRVLLNWQGHLAFASQNEPDTRDLYRSRGLDGVYRLGSGAGAADRQFGKLSDMTGGAGADVSVPTSIIRFKMGGAFVASPRESRVRRFHFEVNRSIAAQSSDEAFAPANIGDTVGFREVTTKDDAFDANRKVLAGYLMGDITRLEPFRLIGGVRYEVATTDLTLGNGLGVDPSVVQNINRRDRALLPAVNAVYAVSERSNLRAAYGVTVARPHLRELSPTPFFDYVRGRVVSGDPNLAQTMIHNVDLRWETFLSASELAAVSVFYKYFEDPIERTVVSAGDSQNLSFANSSSAKSFGAEWEARVTGRRVSPRLSTLYLGANVAYIWSAVQIDNTGGKTRPLQGQSPYVTNVELGYQGERLQASILYNVFGRRLAEVGSSGAGDVYEESFQKLDVSARLRFANGLALKASAVNLLNQQVRFTESGAEIYSYRPGVTGLVSLEWTKLGNPK